MPDCAIAHELGEKSAAFMSDAPIPDMLKFRKLVRLSPARRNPSIALFRRVATAEAEAIGMIKLTTVNFPPKHLVVRSNKGANSLP